METAGLTTNQAKIELNKVGPNRLAQKKTFRTGRLLIQQFKSPLIYILVLAAIVTAGLGEWGDALVISLAVVLNTVLGFYQEFKAEQSLEALSQALAPKAKVKRDGQWQIIKAEAIVPGDLVRLEIGNRVPADGYLVQTDNLSLNEAILTGESQAVKKFQIPNSKNQTNSKFQISNFENIDNNHKVFMGTTIDIGIAKMLVVNTGMQTAMGKIAQSLKETKTEATPLQHQVAKLSRVLALIVGLITIVLFIIGVLEGGNWLEMFETAVAVAVAAIPEGLVVSLTAILALGMQRILKRQAVVRKLVAAETLGATTVICCDKTGTLTQGQMQVVSAESLDEDLLAKAAVLCNDMRDPLETSMMAWAQVKLGIKFKTLKEHQPRLAEIPFDPDYKYIVTLHPGLMLVSGAPEVILSRSNLSKKLKQQWLTKFKQAGNQGLRLVGFAYQSVAKTKKKVSHKEIKDLDWLGILLYEDPVRSGVAEALAKTKTAGIKVKVITGDYQETATAVVNKLRLVKGGLKASQVINGDQLKKLTDQQLKTKIDDLVLFARTDPMQKLRIVQALQEKGEVVAMTGDGVNDAPALKKADIGIVVESASDVSKETAEIVLLNSNFKTILAAVEEGRKIWENIRKVVTYLLADSFTEVILIGGALLFRWPLPILATQILWVNLVEDGLPGLALVFEKESAAVMQEKPRSKKEPILNLEMKTLIFVIGMITDVFLLALFYYLYQKGLPLNEIRTFIFAAVGLDSLFYIFSCKSLKRNLWQIDLLSNKVLLAAVAIGLAMLLLGIYLPLFQGLLNTVALTGLELLALLALAMFEIGLIELVKAFFLRH